MRTVRRSASTTPRRLVVGLFVFGVSCTHRPPSPPPQPVAEAAPTRTATRVAISSAALLVSGMHDRYASEWYHTLTFTQKTKVVLASGSEVNQTWYEALDLPGKLRIDTDLSAKNGVLYVGDSVFTFTNGKLVRADTGTNELLVLGFDVYVQPAARTQSVLSSQGFDLAKFHETTWQGKPVFVVGALEGDTTSKQFWVERERLLVVRVIRRSPQGRSDIRVGEYVAAGGGWVPKDIEHYVNGRLRLRETYVEVRTDVALSPTLFDARQWATSAHWFR